MINKTTLPQITQISAEKSANISAIGGKITKL